MLHKKQNCIYVCKFTRNKCNFTFKHTNKANVTVKVNFNLKLGNCY